MKFGIIQFPGSNCDHDALWALQRDMHQDAELLWHKESDLRGADVIVLPGGFSYGDYLRAGAIARFSPIMKEVVRFAQSGGPVIGICNGFQILCESGLLPGILLRNRSLRFVCEYVKLRVVNNATMFTNACAQNQILEIPIAHGEGNFVCDSDTLKELQDTSRIVLQYCDAAGNITDDANPNGAMCNIAGIVNASGNVMGMMPHPERACDAMLMGHSDGAMIFQSIINQVVEISDFGSRISDNKLLA